MFKNAMSAVWLLLITVICSSHFAFAEDNSADAAYKEMVEQSLKMPDDFDFAKVRDLFTKASTYHPYSLEPKMDLAPLLKRVEAGDKSALDEIENYTTINFALPEAHSRAKEAATHFKDAEKMKYHAWALHGLIFALMSSGDGKSAQTAVHVVNVPEEFMFMRSQCVEKPNRQRLENKNARVYDVLTCKGKDTGEPKDVWFDITPVFARGIQ